MCNTFASPGSPTPAAPQSSESAALNAASRKLDAAPPPVLYRQATLVSGEEDAEPYVADLLVQDGLIKRISSSADLGQLPDGCQVVQGEGLWLSPGFIDMHAHSDLYLLTHPAHEPKITQGCTVSRCLPRVV